jgi:spermidine/putrescine transport system substrate-binding protein
MSEDGPFDQRLSRDTFLKLAGAAGAAAALGGTAAAASAARHSLADEKGALQVLDWAGYEVPQLWLEYAKKYPGDKPKFTFMTNEANALAKMHAGFKPDLVHPCVGWVRDFHDQGLIQAFDTSKLKNFHLLNPTMVKAGQLGGKQWWIPADWGFSAILYRTDKVQPKANSWGLIYDERYKGRISWFDDINQLVVAGYYLGFKQPYNQTDAELKQSQKLLISKKHLVRTIWSSETEMNNDFASGNIWIAYAWPADYVTMKGKGLKVRYMKPKEGPLSWVCGFVLAKDSPRVDKAHAYVDSWSSTRAAAWLEDNYAYGEANTHARPKNKALLRTLAIDDPGAIREPRAHIDRYYPRRTLYSKLWDEVKAS